MSEYETIKKWVNLFDEKIYYKLKPLTKKELYEIAIKQEEEIERLNNIIGKAIKWFDNADRRGLNELLDILKGVDKE